MDKFRYGYGTIPATPHRVYATVLLYVIVAPTWHRMRSS